MSQLVTFVLKSTDTFLHSIKCNFTKHKNTHSDALEIDKEASNAGKVMWTKGAQYEKVLGLKGNLIVQKFTYRSYVPLIVSCVPLVLSVLCVQFNSLSFEIQKSGMPIAKNSFGGPVFLLCHANKPEQGKYYATECLFFSRKDATIEKSSVILLPECFVKNFSNAAEESRCKLW